MNASVILISGCQDNQESADGDANGLFTEKLLSVWDNGAFTGGYPAFHQAILSSMPSTQSPNYYTVGKSNEEFEAQQPFTVETPSESTSPSTPSSNTSSSTWPSINGPASLSRMEQQPYFAINAGPGRHFAVEVATSALLFDRANHEDEQTDYNFYGSWSDSPLLEGDSYTLPSQTWQKLRDSEKLYYRLLSTTSSPSNPGWEDYIVSSGDLDGESIPSIQIY